MLFSLPFLNLLTLLTCSVTYIARSIHVKEYYYMLNMWMRADVSRRRHRTRSIKLAHIATPLTVITHGVQCLPQTETGAAVTCHDVTPIHRHYRQ